MEMKYRCASISKSIKKHPCNKRCNYIALWNTSVRLVKCIWWSNNSYFQSYCYNFYNFAFQGYVMEILLTLESVVDNLAECLNNSELMAALTR